MTQEEKSLLFQDLCARQPYKVKISVDDDNLFIPTLKYIDGINCHFYECAWTEYIDKIKPYLRSLSSMTDEEREEYRKFSYYGAAGVRPYSHYDFVAVPSFEKMDWLNAHHFDYRGLIEKGLALEAPEDMYNTKQIFIDELKKL